MIRCDLPILIACDDTPVNSYKMFCIKKNLVMYRYLRDDRQASGPRDFVGTKTFLNDKIYRSLNYSI